MIKYDTWTIEELQTKAKEYGIFKHIRSVGYLSYKNMDIKELRYRLTQYDLTDVHRPKQVLVTDLTNYKLVKQLARKLNVYKYWEYTEKKDLVDIVNVYAKEKSLQING